MHDEIEIRASLPEDGPALEDLYRHAFPDEDLLPLVRDLLREERGVFSFVTVREGAVAGHVVFALCRIEAGGETCALLGPLAVHPTVQKSGIGSALVREGVKRVGEAGAGSFFVLGDPNYYGRFGFEADARVKPPYTLPDDWREAWQSLRLGSEGAGLAGTLVVPEPWRDPVYWAP